jgi:hypothetical protein
MKRHISEQPEKWVILKIGDYYKVFGTWAGGYLDGDRWKLNSGIKEVEQDKDFYYFIGYSGSCYKCYKKAYGTATSYGRGVLYNIIDESKGCIVLMDDCDDWTKIINHEKKKLMI